MKTPKNKWATMLSLLSLLVLFVMSSCTKDNFGDDYLPTELEKTMNVEPRVFVGVEVPTIPVTFYCDAKTSFGENIYLTGDCAALRNWSVSNALLMSSALYPQWSVTVDLPANTLIKYTFLRIKNGVVTWDLNFRSITTPSTGTYTVFNVFEP